MQGQIKYRDRLVISSVSPILKKLSIKKCNLFLLALSCRASQGDLEKYGITNTLLS